MWLSGEGREVPARAGRCIPLHFGVPNFPCNKPARGTTSKNWERALTPLCSVPSLITLYSTLTIGKRRLSKEFYVTGSAIVHSMDHHLFLHFYSFFMCSSLSHFPHLSHSHSMNLFHSMYPLFLPVSFKLCLLMCQDKIIFYNYAIMLPNTDVFLSGQPLQTLPQYKHCSYPLHQTYDNLPQNLAWVGFPFAAVSWERKWLSWLWGFLMWSGK